MFACFAWGQISFLAMEGGLSVVISAEMKSAEMRTADAGREGDKRRATKTAPPGIPSLSELKTLGAEKSAYLQASKATVEQPPQRDALTFAQKIKPILDEACVDCHGPYGAEASFDITAIDPDLVDGGDAEWWEEVLRALNNGEMPPPNEVEMLDQDRATVVEWLSSEIHFASIARRARESNTSFRRLTKYEYNYALQDLLGEPWDFAKDLPPESVSEDGFENSSDSLHLSVSQFETYRQLARRALDRVTVRGPRPDLVRWQHSMSDAAAIEERMYQAKIKRLEKRFEDDAEKREQQIETATRLYRNPGTGPYYLNVATGEKTRAKWEYSGAQYAIEPVETSPQQTSAVEATHVAVLPAGRNPHLTIELGNQVPDEGLLRVRVRASRAPDQKRIPSMQLVFGWRATNEGRADVRVSKRDTPVTAAPGEAETYEWLIPIGEIDPRNAERKTSTMGRFPSPSEYIRLVNSSVPRGGDQPADIVIESVEVVAPIYHQWPPKSHQRIFPDNRASEELSREEEVAYARDILTSFMPRAWRSPVDSAAVENKLALFETIRGGCEDFQDAMLEVLATVLTSPKFLYVAPKPMASPVVSASPVSAHAQVALTSSMSSNRTAVASASRGLAAGDLATRLSLFLWCSVPDERLLELAASGTLHQPEVLHAEVDRMLADPRHERFVRHFVGQWLGLQALSYLSVDKSFTQFDPALKEAMEREPQAFFAELLRTGASVLDVIHANYATVNERLAVHYGIAGVEGNEFRRVSLNDEPTRGGVLTQAGLLAMNSDGEHSHPLKRGVWILKCLLNDPPPPPPAAVPEIDLADPEIAKLTLKQRIEDHRNQAACMSCHQKIDPWGIAFENYDAIGQWRDEVKGLPVDASSALYNDQVLDGIDGLKRYLLNSRQDQVVRAMVEKLAIFALGRPLAFSDNAAVEEVTRAVRQDGDGLKTLVHRLVASELFLAP
ncbi:DUF1592 domain-containing protein [Aporhodopirellula aestuarii]|uniref:DUF1592 domain-containing protein n=1 Tax=Aporhodopirellula aestuarii TaxID=2950107 RepID=A0ABT0UC09_9BACT|nr:DUF1592 domain-containing protein [Aporhodopirellula aestuarii]MCM2373871.1 DUF1592 domain-containing protein [Aporhodopirellula aestuarii]